MTGMLALAIGVASASCPEPTDAAGLEGALERAEARFASLDPAGFADALRQATLGLPCLADPVAPELAARYHTLVALELYGAGRVEDARASFASARAASPDRGLPVALVPAGHELHARFAEAPIDGPRQPFPPPAAGELLLDGRSRDARPTDRPVIAQHVAAGGDVRDTRYLLPQDPLPPYEPLLAAVGGDPLPGDPPLPVPRRPGVRPPWGWLGVTAVAGAGSLAMFALGNESRKQFLAPLPSTADEGDLHQLQSRTNRLYVGAGAAGVAAAGGVVGFVVGWALKAPPAEAPR